MQTNTTNNSTSTTTTKRPATISDLIARRRVERAEQEQQREQARAEERAAAEEEARDRFAGLIGQNISQEAWDALQPTITYEYSDYDPTSASRCAATFQHNGADWRITTHTAYDAREWWLIGPADYRAELMATRYGGLAFEAQILDAIEAFPAWLEKEIEQRSRKEAAERQRRIHSTGRGGEDKAVLTIGRVLTVRVRQARGTLWDIPGTLLDFTNRWLLLDVPSKGQKLIPYHRVAEIIPGLTVICEEGDEGEQSTEPNQFNLICTRCGLIGADPDIKLCFSCVNEIEPEGEGEQPQPASL